MFSDDPLQDSAAPRYAIESDDEEDEQNPLRIPSAQPPAPIAVRIVGDPPQDAPLLIASARAGAVWARGADLGEQIGAVFVDKIQVGLLFQPSWTQSTVLVSEAFTLLPLSHMHPYASHILSALRPTAVSLLDTYSVASYASPAPTAGPDSAPLRFLSLPSSPAPPPSLHAQPFQPPNLLQSTTAAFLLWLRLQEPPVNATLLLLPSRQLPAPPPKTLLPTHIPGGGSPDHEDAWPADTLTDVTRALLSIIGEESSFEWKAKGGDRIVPAPQRRSEVGEGGMYL
ncbi:hypothetical protein D9611_011454 [Ephemerocybe angulata]|uniref:Uncharacterized protein n=1 Tax=Ephemerocybe angulata TaxID=980116 RepID=A0A8H5CE46_9AGAR|nr:hypothetical protein D9611_011454 [Tulosesus angulatus]